MQPSTRTFEIAHCLGRGGFGEVYRATLRTQGGLESDVAVKVLRRDLDPRSQSVQRLRDEGKLLAKLDHPVILRVLDLATLEGRVALVTEYVAGEDLEPLMTGPNRIGMRALCEVVAKVGHALDAAWNAPLEDGRPMNLVHRDIKPSNIRIGKHGEVKLLDFGIARTDTLTREAKTKTDMMVGSPPFMAPERFRQTEPDPASDVFALGATLFEGLTRRRFYGRADFPRIAGLAFDADSFQAHLDEQLGRIQEDTHPDLKQLIADSLVREPGDRLTSAELADRCEQLVDQLSGPTLARWCRGRTWKPESDELAELSGRTLTEGTRPSVSAPPSAVPEHPGARTGSLQETSLEIVPPPGDRPVQEPGSVQPGANRTRAVLGLSGVLALLSLLAGTTLLVFGVGGLVWQNWDAGDVEELAPTLEPVVPSEPADDVSGAPEPEPEPEPAPDVPVEPRPRRPATPLPGPRPAPPPDPQPAPVAPDPAPDPTGSPARVEVTGGVPVVAIGAGRTVALPADLEAGTWTVRATFSGANEVEVAVLDLKPGDRYQVSCRARMVACSVTPL